MDFRGDKCKKIENSRGHSKFDWKSRAVNFKKISSTGGYNFFFLEKPNWCNGDGKEIQ